MDISEDFVARVARGSVSLSSLRYEGQRLALGLSPSTTKSAIKSLIVRAEGYKSRGQVGRLCATVVIGAAAFGGPFIDNLDTSRLLVTRGHVDRFDTALVEWTARLRASCEGSIERLRERFETYAALYALRLQAIAEGGPAVDALRRRPFAYGKSLVALLDHAFLRGYYEITAGASPTSVYRDIGQPEEVAAAVSSALALANDVAPLDSLDFTFPMGGLDLSAECASILRHGHLTPQLA